MATQKNTVTATFPGIGPERIKKAYSQLLESVKRQGVEWVNPELKTTSEEFENEYFYVILDSASEIIGSGNVDLYRVLFYDGKIRASYRINEQADF